MRLVNKSYEYLIQNDEVNDFKLHRDKCLEGNAL
jgi:hypothetical protein